MAGPLEALRDRRRLADGQPGPDDLGRLVLEDLQPSGCLAGIDRQLGERGPVRPPALDRLGDSPPLRPETGIGVEQVPLPGRVKQSLLIMLTMDVDERPGRRGRAGPP